MANCWNQERRARQAILIINWQPWKKSTGPKSPAGKARSAMRGYKGNPRKELQKINSLLNEFSKMDLD